MKKVLATLSIVSTLALHALPALAANGDIKIGGNNNGTINNNVTKNITNVNVQLDDIKGHWAEKYISALVKKGILEGKEEHKFDPEAHVTRAEFAAMIARYFHLKNTSTQQDFEDVPSSFWGYRFIEASKDYFDAYKSLDGGLQFKPHEGDKREDVTVTLVKILMKLNHNLQLLDAASADQLLKEQFPNDESRITPALRQYVATAVKVGLIQGMGEGSFAPKRVLTRAESATLLARLQDNSIVIPADQTGSGTVTGSVYGTGQ
jgi:hypothetical protein